MFPNGVSLLLVLLVAATTFMAPGAHAQTPTLVTIVEGNAALIRQTTRHVLAEGVALSDQDIVETAAGGFVQIEFPDGVLLDLGESTRLMLRPRVGKGLSAPTLYLLEGWVKSTAGGAFGYVSPGFELTSQAATVVVYAKDEKLEVFTENGTAKVVLRDGPRTTAQLGGGDFGQRRETAASMTVSRRATPEFLARVPRQFRDRLPARAAQLARRNVTPKATGEISYDDVGMWLRTEPAIRLPLLPLWKARAVNDKAFRAGAKADLKLHPEWEQWADPEGYARRLAEEAERRRAREAARAAAAASAAPSQ